MKTGTVIGPLSPSKTAQGFEQGRWVQLRTQQGIEVALDPIGVKPGQTVILATGPAAQCTMIPPTDALIVAVVE